MPVPDYEMPRDVVPPGNQTGIYYIPISNLPFNVSWQEVKDFVSQVCTVSHVEIFPKSTSGWVRVAGYDQFRAAFEQLNGKEFKGRAIIADDRNADRPLKVRGSMASGSGPSTKRPASSTPKVAVEPTPHASLFEGGPVSYPGSSVMPSKFTASASSTYGQDNVSFSMPMPAANYMASPNIPFAHSVMLPGYEGHTAAYPLPPAPSTTSCGYYGQQTLCGYSVASDRPPTFDQLASYSAQPFQPYGECYPAAPSSIAVLSDQMADMIVRDGGRAISGIHLGDLSRRASCEQIRRMIGEVAGAEACLIKAVDVPLDKDGNLCGYAKVHLGTADFADRMRDKLQGVEFKGRKLQVRLLTEGEKVASGGGYDTVAATSPRGHHGNNHSHGNSHSHGHSHGHGHSHSHSHSHRNSKHSHGSSRSGKDHGRRSERRDKTKETDADRAETRPTAALSPGSCRGPPLVVGPGPPEGIPSSKAKDKGKDKHGCGRKAKIVIADGSSCKK